MTRERRAGKPLGCGAVEERKHYRREIESARAKRGLAESVIATREAAMDKMLGRRFESGVALGRRMAASGTSPGAYLRDAQLLVLDETYGRLDARSEMEVFSFRTLADFTMGKMALSPTDLTPRFYRGMATASLCSKAEGWWKKERMRS